MATKKTIGAAKKTSGIGGQRHNAHAGSQPNDASLFQAQFSMNYRHNTDADRIQRKKGDPSTYMTKTGHKGKSGKY